MALQFDGVRPVDADGNPVLAGSVVDSSGKQVNPSSFAQTLSYNSDGTVNTISFTNGTNTWTQTFTYTNSRVTGISAWVKS